MDEIKSLMDQYIDWLRSKTTLRQIDNWVEIITPYLDRHNDYLQIYAKRQNDSFILTDDGYILGDLEQSGCKLESPKRLALLQTTLNGFGVRLSGDVLEVEASKENFSLKKHNLLQAMLAVNDLFYLASPMISSIFYEDVVAWLDQNEIRYITNVKFTGKSGLDHHFDFVIPKSKEQPDRFLQAINRPSKDEVMAAVFAWLDIREMRTADSRAFAILNDSEREVSPSVRGALERYEVKPFIWSNRDVAIPELTA
jgi:hypothetical protein